jgi:hypothetical protein
MNSKICNLLGNIAKDILNTKILFILLLKFLNYYFKKLSSLFCRNYISNY